MACAVTCKQISHTATFPQKCSFCQGHIFVGDPIVKSYEGVDIVTKWCMKKCSRWVMGKPLETVVMDFLGGAETLAVWVHRMCDPNIVTTMSGRKTAKPLRFDERKFVKGSGAGGDHYQQNFDYKTLYPSHNERISPMTSADREFVVKDDELTCQHALGEEFNIDGDSEIEWDSGDETEEEECSWDCDDME